MEMVSCLSEKSDSGRKHKSMSVRLFDEDTQDEQVKEFLSENPQQNESEPAPKVVKKTSFNDISECEVGRTGSETKMTKKVSLNEHAWRPINDDGIATPRLGQFGTILDQLDILQRQFDGFAAVQFELKRMIGDIKTGGHGGGGPAHGHGPRPEGSLIKATVNPIKAITQMRSMSLHVSSPNLNLPGRTQERSMSVMSTSVADLLGGTTKSSSTKDDGGGSPKGLKLPVLEQANSVKEPVGQNTLKDVLKMVEKKEKSEKEKRDSADFHPLAPISPEEKAASRASSKSAKSEKLDPSSCEDKTAPEESASFGGLSNPPKEPLKKRLSQQTNLEIKYADKVESGFQEEEAECWAEAFALRVAVTARENRELLETSHYSVNSRNGQVVKAWLTMKVRSRTAQHLHDLFGKNESMLRTLQALALLSVFFAPLQFALEPVCEYSWERHFATGLKSLHIIFSIVYVAIATNYYWNRFSASRKKVSYIHILPDCIALGGVVGEILHLSETPHRAPSLAQYFCMLHFVKLWRVLSSSKTAQSSSFVVQVFELIIVFMYMGHAAACFAVRLALVEHAGGMTTWADQWLQSDDLRSCTELYSAGLYFTSYTMTGVGYGDIVPANALEHLLCVLYMVLTQFVAAKIFAEITWITQTLRHSKAEYFALLSQTAAVLASMGAPARLRRRVRAYQDFAEQQRERKSQDCLQDLSRPLREELKLLVYYDLVLKAPFLQEQPPHMVRAIIMRLKDLVYLPCEIIVRKGDVGTELFFLRLGCAGVFTTEVVPQWNDTEVHLLKSGNYFGEIALLTGMPRASWVVARTYCSCSVLSKQVMDELMVEHPDGVTGLLKAFQDALGLSPTTTWEVLFPRLCKEFFNERDVYKYCCKFSSVPGCLTWQRWELLTERLGISGLDAKLLWVDLQPSEETGAVDFEFFMDTLKKAAGRDWINSASLANDAMGDDDDDDEDEDDDNSGSSGADEC